MENLVPWKKKVNKYHDEADEDEGTPRAPKLIDTMQTPAFVMRDEHNAEVMKTLKFKQWWK